MSYINKYYPKRPIRSFQDLQVYQITLALAVDIVKKVKKPTDQNISEALINIVLNIPKYIATAHSLRFGDPLKAISRLEKTMLNCNLAIYYLELYRDIVNPTRKTDKAIEADYFDKQIKSYLAVRGQILRLQKSWIKFMPPQNHA